MFLQWLLACSRDVMCVIRCFVRIVLGRIDFRRPITLNKMKLPPIILVHGSSGNQSEWIDAIPLIETCFPNHPIYAFSLDLPFEHEAPTGRLATFRMKRLSYQNDWTIEQYANELHKRINTPCVLIGHSMGGLVCAEYERQHPDNVLYVVAFASPFRGAPLLRNAIMKKVLHSNRHIQMRPKSMFLSSLESYFGQQQNRAKKYLTIGSYNDFQVPNDWAQLPNVQHVDVRGYGHFSIVLCEEAWKYVQKKFT